MIKYRPKNYLVPLLFLLLTTLSFWSNAQPFTVETQELETPITGKAVLYATVLITDTDETGSIDGLFGLSEGPVSIYDDFSCIVRWNGSVGGSADVHVNGAYNKTAGIPIAFNTKYSLWFDIDMTALSYTAYIQTPDMDNPVAMSAKGTFRKTAITSITRWTATKQNSADDGPHVGTVAIVNSVGQMPASRSESTLTALSFTAGSLSPAFSPDVFTYDLSIPAGVSSVTITPSVKDRGTKVTGGGVIDVSAGAGTVTIDLVSDDETASNTYTINYTVLDENSDATLTGITVDKGKFSPKFNKEILNYYLDLPLGQKTANIGATATKAGQGQSAVTIDNNGAVDVSSGNQKVNIVVTAPNGVSTLTYSVTVRAVNLKHSYTFEDGTANDVVGSAHGTINGDVEFQGGALVTDTNGEFVSFSGADLNLSAYKGISVETFITAGNAINTNWHMLWYFGGAEGGASFWTQLNTAAGTGEPYSRVSITPGGTANADYSSEVDDGQLHHVVAVVDTDSVKFYLDGQKVAAAKTNASSISGISKTYAFLGESGYSSDPTWMGTYHEFNIYEGRLTAADVAARSYAFLSDASLKSIELSSGVLSPAFNKETFAYTATVPSNLSTVTVNALSTAPSATVSGAGEVSVGSQTKILVTSSTGNESKTYTIDWTKLGANADATLASLSPSTGSLMPEFNSMVTSYEMALPYGVETVSFTSSASTSGATIVANPSVDVSSGEATYEVTVISSDASVTNKYTVHLTVDPFKLTGLVVSGIQYNGEIKAATLSPAFSDEVSEYTVTFASNMVKSYVSSVSSNDPNLFIDFPDTVDLRYVDNATMELEVTSENLENVRSIKIHVAVSENVYHTSSGTFDPALAAKNHVIYARMHVPDNGVAVDGLFSFSRGKAREFAQTSGGIRFAAGQGILQINNNGTYEPASGSAGVAILYDTVYHAWIKISPADTLYSVYARLDGASEPTTIGENAFFRFDTNVIDTWAALSATGSNQGIHVERVELVNSVGTIPAMGTSADLSAIMLDQGTLSPAFDPSVLEYTAVVPSSVSSVMVSAMAADKWAVVAGAGEVIFDNGAGIATIMVVSEDGKTTKTYTVSIAQSTQATDATLSALTADKGTLSPVFSASVASYTLNVPALTTSVTLTASTAVDGATVSGAGLIDLTGGSKKVDIIVTAQDGVTTMTYSVDIKIAAASAVATLESLRVDVGTLSPTFSSAVTAYAVTVPFGTQSVKVTYKPTDAGATATVTSNGVVAVSHLNVTTAEVVVTAQDGVTKKTYTISITVTPPSTDSSLKALSVSAGSATLNPAFSASVFSYTVDVPFGMSAVTVSAESNYAGLTKISGIGTIDVSSGSATANVVVTAEDGSTSTYVITFTVLDPATDANLASITVQNGTLEPVFNPDVLEYISVVPLGTFTANVGVTLSDSRATYSGAGAIDVVTGSGVATIVVKAEDVTVTKTYKVTIYVGSKPKVVLSAEEQLAKSLNIYPNPASELITLDLAATEMNEVQVAIFNVDGKLLKSQLINRENNTIDISTLRSGLLMVQLKYGDTTVVRKVLKK